MKHGEPFTLNNYLLFLVFGGRGGALGILSILPAPDDVDTVSELEYDMDASDIILTAVLPGMDDTLGDCLIWTVR